MTRTGVALVAAVLCLTLVSSSRASAQGLDADGQVQLAEARRHFEALEYEQAVPSADRAVALLQGKPGDAARRALTEALEIRARSRFGLGDAGAARLDFIELLKAEPQYTLPQQVNRNLVSLFSEARRKTVTTMQLALDPPDATVVLDGRMILDGRMAKPGASVAVLLGRHTIAASREGYETLQSEFNAEAEVAVSVPMRLKRSSAVLSVMTSPAAVEVVIDGVSRGHTAAVALTPEQAGRASAAGIVAGDEVGVLNVANVVTGTHRIQLSRACYGTVERMQAVTQLADYPIDPAKLSAAMATVITTTKQADALVYLDGESRGAAPNTAQVCEGPHVVELRAPTGRYLQRIDARVGQRLEVTGSLRPAFALVSSTQTTLNADLRASMERALQPLSSILVFAPPAESLAATLKTEKLPPNWLAYDINRRPLGVTAEVTAAERRDLSARLAKAFDAQGIAAVTAPGPSNRTHLVLTLLAAGVAEPDVVDVDLDQPDALAHALARLDGSLAMLAPSLGATVVDVVDLPGPVVIAVDANGPAAKVALRPGDIIVEAGGAPIADATTLTARIGHLRSGQSLSMTVQDRSGARRTLDVPVQMRPRLLGLGDQTVLVNRTLVALRARLVDASSPDEQAAIRLNLAAALAHLESWTEARAELQQVTLSDGPGVGPGTDKYLLGICQWQLGNRTEAEAAFAAAAASNSLLTEDGLPVKELADARLADVRRGQTR